MRNVKNSYVDVGAAAEAVASRDRKTWKRNLISFN